MLQLARATLQPRVSTGLKYFSGLWMSWRRGMRQGLEESLQEAAMALHSWCDDRRVRTPPGQHKNHRSLFESLRTCQYSWSSSAPQVYILYTGFLEWELTTQRRCHSANGCGELSLPRRSGVTEMMEPCRWYLATWRTCRPNLMKMITALEGGFHGAHSRGFRGGH